jgi:hypothetical protein
VAYALVWLLAWGFVALGVGIGVLGVALSVGNRTGPHSTFPFAGLLGIAAMAFALSVGNRTGPHPTFPFVGLHGIAFLGFALSVGNRTGRHATFLLAGLLTMAIGWNILKIGTGSLARIRAQARCWPRAGAASAPQLPSPAAPAPRRDPDSPSTRELPLTSEMQRCLEAACSRSRRALGAGAAVLLVYTLVLGGLFVSEEGPVGLRYTFYPLGLGTGVGGIMWAALLGEHWLLQKDRRRSTFLRTTGPMSIWRFQSYHQLNAADRTFSLAFPMAAKLSGLRWGVVDSTKHARHIFEVRAQDGRVAYRHPEYRTG